MRTDRNLYYLDLAKIELSTREEARDIRTNYLWPEEVREKEDKSCRNLITVVGTIIGAVCVIGGSALICRRRKVG